MSIVPSQVTPMTAPADSVLTRMVRGAGWVLGWRVATRLLGLLNTLLLVRLLLPGDFGLVALGVSFAKAIEGLSDLGIEDALVRAPSPHREMYDTGFTLSVLRGAVTALVVAICAWPTAVFFDDQRLIPILLVLAAGSLIGSVENIGIVDFRRDMRFHREFALLVFPRLASIAVMVGLALLWRTYWALIAGSLTMQVLRVIMTYVMHPFRPRITLTAWDELSSFSLWSWATSLVVLIRDRVDTFAIGRILGTTKLGIYALGLDIACMPTTEIAAPLGRVAMSGFAIKASEGDGSRETYLRILASVLLVGLPAGFGISLVADPVVHILMGSNWLAAIGSIRILGIAGSGALFGAVTSSLLIAHAMLRPLFKVYLLSLVARAVAIIAMVSWLGLNGAAWGWAIATAVEHAACVCLAMRQFRIGFTDLAARLWRPFAAVAAMTLCLYSVGLGWSTLPRDGTGAATTLIEALATGAVTYGGVLWLLWHTAGRPDGAEADLLALARRYWRGRTRRAA